LKKKERTKRLERNESVDIGVVVGFFESSSLRSSRLLSSAFADVSKCDLRANECVSKRNDDTSDLRAFHHSVSLLESNRLSQDDEYSV